MTLGDLLRQEGRAEGEIKGKAEGRAEGKAEGKAEGSNEGKLSQAIADARKMREHGISWEIVTDVTGLRPEDLEDAQP